MSPARGRVWILLVLAGCATPENPPARNENARLEEIWRRGEIPTVLDLGDWHLYRLGGERPFPEEEPGKLHAWRDGDIIRLPSSASLSALLHSISREGDVREFYRLVERYLLDEDVPEDFWVQPQDTLLDRGIVHPEPGPKTAIQSILINADGAIIDRQVAKGTSYARIRVTLRPHQYEVQRLTEK